MSIDIDSGLPDPENRTTKQHYTYWIRVEAAVGAGQQVSVNGRSLTQADGAYVTQRRKEYEDKLINETTAAAGPSRFAPVYLG